MKRNERYKLKEYQIGIYKFDVSKGNNRHWAEKLTQLAILSALKILEGVSPKGDQTKKP